MTRIGRCRVRPDTKLAMLPTARQISPRSAFPDQPPSNQSVVPMFAWLPYWSCIPEWHLIHKVFFKIAVADQTKFKDADAIANTIGGDLSLKYVSI
jgi:hypothetical protein